MEASRGGVQCRGRLRMRALSPPRVAVIVERYPSLSESFVRRDIERLLRDGFDVMVVACNRDGSDDAMLHAAGPPLLRPQPTAVRMRAGVRALPLYPRTLRGVLSAARAESIAGALQPALAVWKPHWLHAHFLAQPAVVGALLSDALHVPLSISAHARDIFQPSSHLPSLCERARFIATCSEQGHASLLGRIPATLAARVHHLPHAVECTQALAPRPRASDGVLRILSVCRLVPKKGIDVALRAVARIRPHVRIRYRIAGDGPELPRLRALVRSLALDELVELMGPVSPAGVDRELAAADVFLLGTRNTAHGDRDGIPNALLEAMAAGVPVVATDGGAVSEVVRDGDTGMLVPPNDPGAVAYAVLRLADDARLRHDLAERAHAEIRRRFAIGDEPSPLSRRLALELERPIT